MVLLQKAFQLGGDAGNYAWSEMLHRLTFPYAENSLLSEGQQVQKKGMAQLKKKHRDNCESRRQ